VRKPLLSIPVRNSTLFFSRRLPIIFYAPFRSTQLTDPPMDERLHNGGAMAFGNDGKLCITTGDAGKRHNAGTFEDVHGSIIRLNEDGTVPDDNPHTKASGYSNSYRCADTAGRVPNNAPDDSYCAGVWVNGLRNPFRIDMEPISYFKIIRNTITRCDAMRCDATRH